MTNASAVEWENIRPRSLSASDLESRVPQEQIRTLRSASTATKSKRVSFIEKEVSHASGLPENPPGQDLQDHSNIRSPGLPYASSLPRSPQRISRKPLTYASFTGRSPYDTPSIRSAPPPKPSQLSHSSRRGRSSSPGSRTPEARLNLTRPAYAENAPIPVIPESFPESDQWPPSRAGYGRYASNPSSPLEEPAILQPELTYAHVTPRARLTRAPSHDYSPPKKTHDARVERTEPRTHNLPPASHTQPEPRSSTTTTQQRTTVPLCQTCLDNIARDVTERLGKNAQARHWLAVVLRITLWLPLIGVFFWRTAIADGIGSLWGCFGNRVVLCMCGCGLASVARCIGSRYLAWGLRKRSPYGCFTMLVAAVEGLVCAAMGAAALVWFAGQIVLWRLDRR